MIKKLFYPWVQLAKPLSSLGFLRAYVWGVVWNMDDSRAAVSLRYPPQHRWQIQKLWPWSSTHDLEAAGQVRLASFLSPLVFTAYLNLDGKGVWLANLVNSGTSWDLGVVISWVLRNLSLGYKVSVQRKSFWIVRLICNKKEVAKATGLIRPVALSHP